MHIKEMVERVKTLQELGLGVMIFRAKELYTMSAYANRYTKSRIHFAIRLSVLVRVLEDRYKDLAGTLLEGIARLFTQNVRPSNYPMASEEVQKRVKMARLTGWRWKEIDGMVSRTICIRQDRLILSINACLAPNSLSREYLGSARDSRGQFRWMVR